MWDYHNRRLEHWLYFCLCYPLTISHHKFAVIITSESSHWLGSLLVSTGGSIWVSHFYPISSRLEGGSSYLYTCSTGCGLLQYSSHVSNFQLSQNFVIQGYRLISTSNVRTRLKIYIIIDEATIKFGKNYAKVRNDSFTLFFSALTSFSDTDFFF